MFSSEQEMSIMFEKFLENNFGSTYLKEYQGLFGIPDFVFYSHSNDNISIISFELKLKDWKRAAKQAFRYKSFSNIAYVVLSPKNIHSAIKNIAIFEQYNIGLAKFDKENEFVIYHKPQTSIPYSQTLNKKLVSSIGCCRRPSKNIDTLVR